jgi:hypothetical protein
MKPVSLLVAAVGTAFVLRSYIADAFVRRPSHCKEIDVTSATINVETGAVTLEGALKCIGNEGIVHVEPISLTQGQGENLIKGLDETGLDCGDPAASFIVTIDADEGQFHPGKATVGGTVLIGTQSFPLCQVTVILDPAS